jgi:hypothetical protein
MGAVSTQAVARKATRGRVAARIPVEYESAVKALAECVTLDEAKYWDDASEALKAWARIYGDDEAGVSARRLKLHAYRRMGELALQIRPWKPGAKKGAPMGSGAGKGIPSLLVEHGLALHQANQVSAAARIPKDKFQALVNLPRPPAPNALLTKFSDRNVTAAWREISGVVGGNCLLGFRGWCRGHDPEKMARGLTKSEAAKARECVEEVAEWLDRFERYLKRAGKSK